jgi:hypothetical protein
MLRYNVIRHQYCLLILTQALFAAQGKLLADAAKYVFELQTQRKETQHKVDRLRDYERQIEQHIRMQRLWFAFTFDAPGCTLNCL